MNDKERLLFFKIMGYASAVPGFIVGTYNWMALLILCSGVAVFFLLAFKFSKEVSMRPAIAAMGGHLTGSLFPLLFGGSFGLEGLAYIILPDVIILTIGLIWLMFRPGLVVIILLILWQVLEMISGIFAFLSMEFQMSLFIAHLLHFILEMAAIMFLVVGYKTIDNAKNESL